MAAFDDEAARYDQVLESMIDSSSPAMAVEARLRRRAVERQEDDIAAHRRNASGLRGPIESEEREAKDSMFNVTDNALLEDIPQDILSMSRRSTERLGSEQRYSSRNSRSYERLTQPRTNKSHRTSAKGQGGRMTTGRLTAERLSHRGVSFKRAGPGSNAFASDCRTSLEHMVCRRGPSRGMSLGDPGDRGAGKESYARGDTARSDAPDIDVAEQEVLAQDNHDPIFSELPERESRRSKASGSRSRRDWTTRGSSSTGEQGPENASSKYSGSSQWIPISPPTSTTASRTNTCTDIAGSRCVSASNASCVGELPTSALVNSLFEANCGANFGASSSSSHCNWDSQEILSKQSGKASSSTDGMVSKVSNRGPNDRDDSYAKKLEALALAANLSGGIMGTDRGNSESSGITIEDRIDDRIPCFPSRDTINLQGITQHDLESHVQKKLAGSGCEANSLSPNVQRETSDPGSPVPEAVPERAALQPVTPPGRPGHNRSKYQKTHDGGDD